jgi:hypothetical protein
MPTTQHDTAGTGHGTAAALGAADRLSLAAAPTFALMALTTGLLGGTPDAMCPAPGHASVLTGMAPMYLLMSTFHAAPWLRLLTDRQARGAKEEPGPRESSYAARPGRCAAHVR